MTAGSPQWLPFKLPRLLREASEAGLVSPLMWLNPSMCKDVCEEKLVDMVSLAPSDWDAAVASLVLVCRQVNMQQLLGYPVVYTE